ncbi:MAG: hypothetical protein WBF93_11465 [Pirellulales bacterium]
MTATSATSTFRFRTAILGLALALLVGTLGCSRKSYRLRADADAFGLIEQKTSNPRWLLEDYHVYPDPRSRMASPDSPDFPPMPPDDPDSHELMKCVDGKRGFKGWDRWGETPYVANPQWRSFVPTDGEGKLPLNRNSAVRAALLNSPAYQSELEDLYLSALDVSFERFRFDAQFFGGYQAFLSASGRRHPDGQSSQLALATRNPSGSALEMHKLFAGGGELVVGFANSLIWEFSGPNRHTASTILDFSLIQPLLRGGGRARVLERLTVAERALLANVRQMERFRQGFYTEIVAGLDPGAGPARRGGLSGGSGLEGFSGVGAGGFGRLGSIGLTGNAARGGTGGGQAGGFVGLLQTRQELQNQQINIVALRNSSASLQAKYDAGGRIDFFQVELARQALYNTQSRLLTSQTGYQSQLDDFKINLGLPPDLPLAIDDPMLRQFDLLDPGLVATQETAEDLLNLIRDPEVEFDDRTWGDALVRADRLLNQSGQLIEGIRRDLARLHHNLPNRRRVLENLSQREDILQGAVDAAAYDVGRLNQRVVKADEEFETLGVKQSELAQRLGGLQAPGQRQQLLQMLSELTLLLNDILLLQAQARLDAIVLVPIDVTAENALDVASTQRLDWMNARAALVDSWRLIKFNWNDLQSNVDIVVEGELRNRGDNPFRLSEDAGRLRAGVEFDAPLSRLGERNRYRQALIEYQQARRSYYTFVDRVQQGLRNTIRNVHLNQLNFELRRAAVQLAISQVELARLQLEEPPRPGVEVAGSDNRVQNLVNALAELLNSQNDFLSVWVTYEVLRMSLQFQMGTMQLDSFGLWIDPNSTRRLPSCEPNGQLPEPIEAIPTALDRQTSHDRQTSAATRSARTP